MKSYRQFVFTDYRLDKNDKTLSLSYGYDDEISFLETFKFDFKWAENIDEKVLDRACQLLFFMAGVSYFKAFLPARIEVRNGMVSPLTAAFMSKTYQKGLGEFFYVNGLDPLTEVPFQPNAADTNKLTHSGSGLLVALGGGKDSLVSVEILKQLPWASTWSVGHRSQLEPLVERIGLPHYWVERTFDKKLLELNNQGAYNGHVPISAILACAGTVTAVLSGKKDIVVSNENSANEPALSYQGQDINHQYSKSLEFERDFQTLLQNMFGDSLNYYSFLRPLSEMRIAKMFAETGFDKYKDVFGSCNKAFKTGSDKIFWCGTCPKCAFVFLMLTPFLDRKELESLFGGRNLLLDKSLEQTYRQLLGIEGDKPLECVGEIMESRLAMHRAQSRYAQLSNYKFDLPPTVNYAMLTKHSMPDDMYAVLKEALSKLDT